MPNLELTQEEGIMLKEILESYLSDLRMEISDTDQMNFREGLKKKEVFLKEVIHKLQQTVSP